MFRYNESPCEVSNHMSPPTCITALASVRSSPGTWSTCITAKRMGKCVCSMRVQSLRRGRGRDQSAHPAQSRTHVTLPCSVLLAGAASSAMPCSIWETGERGRGKRVRLSGLGPETCSGNLTQGLDESGAFISGQVVRRLPQVDHQDGAVGDIPPVPVEVSAPLLAQLPRRKKKKRVSPRHVVFQALNRIGYGTVAGHQKPLQLHRTFQSATSPRHLSMPSHSMPFLVFWTPAGQGESPRQHAYLGASWTFRAASPSLSLFTSSESGTGSDGSALATCPSSSSLSIPTSCCHLSAHRPAHPSTHLTQQPPPCAHKDKGGSSSCRLFGKMIRLMTSASERMTAGPHKSCTKNSQQKGSEENLAANNRMLTLHTGSNDQCQLADRPGAENSV